MRKGIGGHQSADSRTNDWVTPPEMITALGPFDLDPCACIPQPWPCATQQYTVSENGLLQRWFGRVWMNPPYSNDLIGAWLRKMSEYGDGIALIFARTDRADYHQYVFPYADSMLFMNGRIFFYTPAGTRAKHNSGAPSLLVAYGSRNVEALGDSGIKGRHVLINAAPIVVVGVSPSWKSVISIALSRLGEADVQVIYRVVEQIAPDKTAANQHWKEKIRQQLQYHFTRIKKGYYGNN